MIENQAADELPAAVDAPVLLALSAGHHGCTVRAFGVREIAGQPGRSGSGW
ncbi:hypothetical protein ACFZB9_16555 [Kitasatospora sp. NPDC008050]|uniref:hypothetical protein n=1 Tax=Kitasatospora sp. NPDC008050 TaxID=3364021 RepID=UPI0036E26FC1